MRKASLWLVWAGASVALAAYLGYGLLAGADQSLFLPGQTTHGHHQIELACESCHSAPFGGGEVLQSACLDCHGAELEAADDAHPRSKFTDPRNAERVAALDARYCVTCHTEHRPERTRPLGLTLPTDFCFNCHQEIASERPSHAGMGFESCASAGCHNFHDNRALYEAFLVKHAHEPDYLASARVLLRHAPGLLARRLGQTPRPLTAAEQDAPQAMAGAAQSAEWAHSAHAQAGVNCSGCHRDAANVWVERPDQRACAGCHARQLEGFMAGKHGMRLVQGLSPMQPALARLPMQPQAHARSLGCGSCHSPHAVDTRAAAAESCLGCHADEHSRGYLDSPHHALWQRELSGALPAGSGVSCATCHMPRERHTQQGVALTVVQHNQNDNLRPNEKMLRSVCQSCHGLGFALDALADPELIRNNFRGRPRDHVPSIEMSVTRERAAAESR